MRWKLTRRDSHTSHQMFIVLEAAAACMAKQGCQTRVSEVCLQEEHVFHMLRIAVERQPSVSAKKAASAKKPLPLQDECLELKVDLHRRNQLLTWEDWEAKIAAGSPDLEDLWMKVDPLVDTATSGKQAVTGFKRKMQGLTGSSHKVTEHSAVPCFVAAREGLTLVASIHRRGYA